MNSNSLQQFVLRSREWIYVHDAKQLIESAMWTLKELYHIENGIFVLNHETTTMTCYDPWHSQISKCIALDNIVPYCINEGEEVFAHQVNKWWAPNELFPQANMSTYNIQQVGLWKVSLSKGNEGVFALGRSTIQSDEQEICACMVQLSLLLECVLRIHHGKKIEQKHNSLIDLNPDAIYEIDLEDHLVYANPAFERITGYSAEELRDMKTRRRIVDKQHLSTGIENYQKAFRGISEAYESVITHKDGHRVDVTMKKIPTVVDGEITGIYCVGKDISEFKRMEMALREAEEKYRILVEGSLMGVYIIQDYKVVYANRKFCDVFGYTLDEVLCLDCRDFIHDDDKGQVTANIHDRLSGSTSKLAYSMKGIRKDQAIIDIEVHGTLTLFNSRPAVVGTLVDITERKKAESLLIKSEKLAVVGELAAGVAHEIRNPLTSLKGFVQLLAERPEYAHYRSIMLSELDRINQIVSEFLMVAKPQTQALEENDVGRVVYDVITLMQTQAIISNVQIIGEIPTDLPPLCCNRNQLKQVFVNLIKNALESMPHGGVVRVQLKAMFGKHLMVRIRDVGSGISKDRLKRLGEPFYTTKEKGTGLGLMVCYKIIANHSGQMRLYSQANKGTSALILLPLGE